MINYNTPNKINIAYSLICIYGFMFTYLEPPQMIISPSQSPHRVTVGTQLLLYCAAEGIPTPTVQWNSNDVPLHPLQQPYQQLYLVPTDSPHTTIYTCIARNHIRDVDRVAQVNVTVIVDSKEILCNIMYNLLMLTDLCPSLKVPTHGKITTSSDGEFAFFSCEMVFL